MIIEPDLIIIDDQEEYIDLSFKCKKIYMCGILTESYKQNIKTIISYTYNDYLSDK